MKNQGWGVWADKNTQLVITPMVLLYYARLEDRMVSGYWNNSDPNYQIYKLRAFVTACPGGSWASTISNTERSRFHNRGEVSTHAMMARERLHIRFDAFGIATDDAALGLPQLEYVEAVCPVVQLAAKTATADSVGDRIRLWNQGTTYISQGTGESLLCIVNTATNWHIFETWEQDKGLSVYCRCAKVAMCDQGMVFAQNIRIIVGAGSSSAESYMIENNVENLKRTLVIDPKKFHQDSCASVGKKNLEWTEIYWSLKEANEERIVLHGCDGKEYTYTRPRDEDMTRIESFADAKQVEMDKQ